VQETGAAGTQNIKHKGWENGWEWVETPRYYRPVLLPGMGQAKPRIIRGFPSPAGALAGPFFLHGRHLRFITG
jgi:hypothetical protein